MRSIVSEKKLVVILFVLVLITFSLAQEDSRKMAKIQPDLMIQTVNWRPEAQRKLTITPGEKTPGITILKASATE